MVTIFRFFSNNFYNRLRLRDLDIDFKVRLLFHGRLLLAAQTQQLLLHASLDPYNTTEEMDVSWTDMTMVWSEAEVKVDGTLDIYVRTASKYDDGHLLHLPNLNLGVKMDWLCLANPKDHHSVMPCAPDKLPGT